MFSSTKSTFFLLGVVNYEEDEEDDCPPNPDVPIVDIILLLGESAIWVSSATIVTSSLRSKRVLLITSVRAGMNLS